MVERDIIQEVWNLFTSSLNAKNYKLYLFGSRAEKTNHPQADFDFIVKGGKPVPKTKWKRFLKKVTELRTLYSIDMVDYYQADEEFREIAEKSMKEIKNGQI